MNEVHLKDLVVLVADADMEQAVRGLLSRPRALGIRREITFDLFRHPRRDPGVFHEAHDFLRPLQKNYRYALVMLDREGSGQENQPAQAIKTHIQRGLDRVGWRNRSAVVVLDPELEVWIFSDSPWVIRVIADGDKALYRQILDSQAKSADGKPAQPKEVLEKILREKRISRSSALYKALAECVDFSGCRDPAFREFLEILQRWFNPSAEISTR